jgi:small-conductance mechanosensitive channel/CRP-like cAMP-binding protein
MSIWDGIWREIHDDQTLWVIAGFVLVMVAVKTLAREERGRLRPTLILICLHLVLLPIVGWGRASHPEWLIDVRIPALVFEILAIVGMAGTLLFGLILPRMHLRVPRILRDVIMAVAAIVAIIVVINRVGINVSGLITTSAVLTAVIGFSLQDTFGNIMGGLALQMDNSIEVGDWVKVGDLRGQVREIRWRYTSIETRNWETVFIPNAQLMRGQVIVEGRRAGRPTQHRRWIYFNVDFRYQPSDVIRVVTEAVTAAPIERVAADPRPSCVLMDLTESYGRYAIRYWLTDLLVDDATDSVLRTRLYFALKRAGIPLSMPAHAVFLTEDNPERKQEKTREDRERRLRALSHVDLFESLSSQDRTKLAEGLRYAPFTAGEAMTRQGAEGHWLYMIIEGEAAVRISLDGVEKEVAKLQGGQFFGEMSLMTGARRTATVVAVTDVECYRLDKAAFQEIIKDRPEMAEELAEILANRRAGLTHVKDDLDKDAVARRLAADKSDILGKIRDFFSLGDAGDTVNRRSRRR